MSQKTSFFKNTRVMVTGSCGTIGKELIRQLIDATDISDLVGLDNNESELFFLEQRYGRRCNSTFLLADIRDQKRLCEAMQDIDIVFHTAAYKHVGMCERSPMEAVQTNIQGVQNVIEAAHAGGVKKVIFTSSDKAVNPTNVMGTSKLMGERLMTAANCSQRKQGTIYASTRFGNVLGSSGSVIPIFNAQIRNGGPVTLTAHDMTRFIMSTSQAVSLVVDSAVLACGGEVFITKMPVIRILDLAEVMIKELAPHYGYEPKSISIEIIGTKPGEKMYEELMNDEETRRCWELDTYYAVLPAFSGLYQAIDYSYPNLVSKEVGEAYSSRHVEPMSQDELAAFLREHKLLENEALEKDEVTQRAWPGDPPACQTS